MTVLTGDNLRSARSNTGICLCAVVRSSVHRQEQCARTTASFRATKLRALPRCAAGCSVLAAAWTFAFIQLATTWYVAGKAEALYR